MHTRQFVFPWNAVLTACCLLALNTLGHAQSPAPTNILVQSGQKVVFMGDSITGMGWGDTGGFVHLVVAGLNALGDKIEPIPAGVGGNKSDDMLARLKTDALDKKPDWLLLSCGVNDVWSRRIDLDTFKKNITSIVGQAQAAGIKVMIVTPTPIYEMAQSEFSKLSNYVAWELQLAHDRKLPLADENAAYFTYLKAQPPAQDNSILTVDGVHPNPDGHQIMAQTVLEAFGVTPDQMAKVKEAWTALPDGANLNAGYGFNNEKITVTSTQAAALEALAAAKKQTMDAFMRGIILESARDAMVAKGNLDGFEPSFAGAAIKLAQANVDKLATTTTASPAGAAPPIHEYSADASTEKAGASGNVDFLIHFGFRGTATLSIPNYQKFKQAAAQRKITPRALVSSVFMEGIRDTLVAHGDLSNVHQDNISGDSWPTYQKLVDAIVK